MDYTSLVILAYVNWHLSLLPYMMRTMEAKSKSWGNELSDMTSTMNGLSHNFLSISQIYDQGYRFCFAESGCKIHNQRENFNINHCYILFSWTSASIKYTCFGLLKISALSSKKVLCSQMLKDSFQATGNERQRYCLRHVTYLLASKQKLFPAS